MNNPQKDEKNSTIKEIGQIFSSIDKRIISLYKCSSDDFVTFNTQLKKYHKQINGVSANAEEIMNLFNSGGDHDFISLLNVFIQDIDQYLNNNLKTSENYILHLERTLKNINSMMLYSRNYKQNLLTYKYLITNLKLSAAYLDSGNSTINEDIDRIIAFIVKVNSVLPSLDGKLNHAKITISEIISSLKRSIQLSSDEFGRMVQQLEYTKNNTERHTQDLYSYIEKLNEKIDSCSENVGQIITHLQFQDIVRQKMEHIQEMHKEVLNIIGSFEDTEIDKLSGIQQARYLIQVRDVAELQVAQLAHTNRQYQKAIELISKMFLIIIENMTDATLLNVMFPSHTRRQNEQFDKAIDSALTHSIEKISHIEADAAKAKVNVEKVYSLSRDVSESVDQLKNHHEELIKQSMVILDSLQQIGLGKYDQKNLLDHLNGLLVTNKNLSMIHMLNNQNNKLVVQLQQSTSKLDASSKNTLLGNIHKNATQIIVDSAQMNKKIQKNLQENDATTNALIDEIFTSMQEVKYYDYFEKIIEEIIQQLNKIFLQLAFNKTSKKRRIKSTAIQHFKDFYTMESERQIHTEIITKDGIIDIAFQDEMEEEKNGDLELF